jgi:plastocyanin
MMSNKNTSVSEKIMPIGLLIVSLAGLGLSSIMNSDNNNTNNYQAEAQQEQVNNTIRVKAGEGNSTDIRTVFVPQKIDIKAGQTINWYNPTPVEEPHSVALLKKW